MYPQFIYWLATPFFAPLPIEADIFFQQKNLRENNITLDFYPVGTGPYYIVQNNPEKQNRIKSKPIFSWRSIS